MAAISPQGMKTVQYNIITYRIAQMMMPLFHCVQSVAVPSAPPPYLHSVRRGIASISIFPPLHTDQALFISGIMSILAEIYKFEGMNMNGQTSRMC
jgi:hypothetical protein